MSDNLTRLAYADAEYVAVLKSGIKLEPEAYRQFFNKIKSMYPYKAIKVDGKKIDEHRHIMQEHLGRKLHINECVHHKDGNKRNNNLSNLEVVDRKEHARHHYLKGDLKIGGGNEHLRIHPSQGAYKRGCRCELCKEIIKVSYRVYRAKKRSLEK